MSDAKLGKFKVGASFLFALTTLWQLQLRCVSERETQNIADIQAFVRDFMDDDLLADDARVPMQKMSTNRGDTLREQCACIVQRHTVLNVRAVRNFNI